MLKALLDVLLDCLVVAEDRLLFVSFKVSVYLSEYLFVVPHHFTLALAFRIQPLGQTLNLLTFLSEVGHLLPGICLQLLNLARVKLLHLCLGDQVSIQKALGVSLH